MLWADRYLIRVHQPAFDQGGDLVKAWHDVMGLISGARKEALLMFATALRLLSVYCPTTGQNFGVFFGNVSSIRYKELK